MFHALSRTHLLKFKSLQTWDCKCQTAKCSLRFVVSNKNLVLKVSIVPSSFTDITHVLCGCFCGGSVYVLFRFVLKQSKASNSVKMSSLIFWLQAKELRFSVCCNTLRNFNGSLNKRLMYPAQTIAIEWTAEKCLDKWQTTSKPPNTS